MSTVQTLCRQKTIDPKTFCPCYYSTKRIVGGKGRGFWCGSCLYIRMGENLHEAKNMKDWRCPCCRDICNCSGANCLRARRNLAVTNQLIHEATKQGFKSVMLPWHEFHCAALRVPTCLCSFVALVVALMMVIMQLFLICMQHCTSSVSAYNPADMEIWSPRKVSTANKHCRHIAQTVAHVH